MNHRTFEQGEIGIKAILILLYFFRRKKLFSIFIHLFIRHAYREITTKTIYFVTHFISFDWKRFAKLNFWKLFWNDASCFWRADLWRANHLLHSVMILFSSESSWKLLVKMCEDSPRRTGGCNYLGIEGTIDPQSQTDSKHDVYRH